MQANYVKSAAFAAESSGVGVRIDAKVIKEIGLQDLAVRLTWVQREQQPEDADKCLVSHEAHRVSQCCSDDSTSDPL